MADPPEPPSVTALTRDEVERLAREYEREEPFVLVENERFETMSTAIREDSFSWKDVEWMVRWYYRRHLSSRVNAPRKRVEEGFRTNAWPDVRATVRQAIESPSPADRAATVADLEGITVPVGTAILYFGRPDRDVVMAEREWAGLAGLDVIAESYPDAPDPADYARYLAAFDRTCDELGVTHVDLQRALWRLEPA